MMKKFVRVFFLVLCFLYGSGLTISNTWAVENSSGKWNTAFDCVQAAYEKAGKKLSDYGIDSSNFESKAIASIVSACESCIKNNGVLGASRSATWFNNSSSNAYTKDAIFDGTDYKGKVFGDDETVYIYLRVAGLLCGRISDGNPMARQFINLQYSKNDSQDNNGHDIEGSCPQGTTRKAGSGSTLPNCDNDGYNKNSFTPNAPTTNNTYRDTYYPPYSIWSDTGSKNRVSLSYLSSAIAYDDENILESGAMVSYGWSNTGGHYQRLTVNVNKFKSDSNVTKNRPSGKHYVNYYQTVYLFGCVPNAYPGMSLMMSEGVTWFYGCVTNSSKLYMRFYDPTLTLKALDTEGNDLSKVISDIVVYGNEAQPTDVSVTRTEKTGYIFQGFATTLANAEAGTYVTATTSTNSSGKKRHYVSGTGGITFHNVDLAENKVRYAVYLDTGKVQNTLVADAVKEDGTILRSTIDSDTVGYNENATVDRTKYSTPTGYTYLGWRDSSPSSGTPTSGDTYSAKLTTSDKTVYAVYARNSFQGEAKTAKSGTSESSGTGFVSTNTTAPTLNITSCSNSDCNVDFELNIKNVGRGGGTDYFIEKKVDSGEWSYIPADEGESSGRSSGSGVKNVFRITKSLLPGQTMCYRLTFNPYGTQANNAETTVTACAKAVLSEFEGKSRVGNGTVWAENGFTKTTETPAYYAMDNCDNGCSVKFEHYLKRTVGSGSTEYYIIRTYNGTSQNVLGKKAEPKVEIFSGISNGTEKSIRGTTAASLYPGYTVCERMYFRPNNKINAADGTMKTGYVSTKACALAQGKWQPGNPEEPGNDAENASFLNIAVKNQTLGGEYNNDYVYAKPGDKITWRAAYHPQLQIHYNMTPERIGINMTSSSNWLDNSFENTDGNMIYVLFNLNRGSLENWNNGFSIQRSFNSDNLNYYKDGSDVADDNKNKYGVGNNENRHEYNSFRKAERERINNDEVGLRINETVITNGNDVTSTTPSQVIFKAIGPDSDGRVWNVGNVITRKITASAEARVPYNFTTEPKVEDGQGSIYAGEENKIKIHIDVAPKHNSLTMKDGDRDYATKVAGAKWKIIVYEGEEVGAWTSGEGVDDLCGAKYSSYRNCDYSNQGGGTLNNYTNLDDMYTVNSSSSKALSFFAQDLAAGSKLCFAAAVYPASSGADDNLLSTGDKRWRVSASKCLPVAKRPSLQVWGGNVYSAGNITTGVSKKKNLAGVGSSEGYRIFGSWGELGIIASGTIKGMASGTSTGYASNNNGALVPEYTFQSGGRTANYSGSGNGSDVAPGGTLEGTVSYCLRSMLSFANGSCGGNNGFTGKITDANTVKGNVTDDKNNIVNSFGSKTRYDVTDGAINLPRNAEEEAEAVNKGVHYKKGGNLTVSGTGISGNGTVNAGTYVVEANNVMISGNLIYGGQYQTLEGVPKIVIYAENNIYINCGVEKIYALLVAKTVVTCKNDFGEVKENEIKDGINSSDNSVQLMVNGAIIANKLIANRTYGAATGANSIISAEIINFDNTLYLWGSRRSEASTSVKLTDAYTREISPRS